MKSVTCLAILTALTFYLSPAHGCAAGYVAPRFLDITDPIIGLGALSLGAAFLLSIRNCSLKPSAALTPIAFVAMANFAHVLWDDINPILWTPIILALLAYIALTTSRLTFRTAVIPLIVLSVTNYGYWTYTGDCGADIVFFNRLAAIIAASWLTFELALLYKEKRHSTS